MEGNGWRFSARCNNTTFCCIKLGAKLLSNCRDWFCLFKNTKQVKKGFLIGPAPVEDYASSAFFIKCRGKPEHSVYNRNYFGMLPWCHLIRSKNVEQDDGQNTGPISITVGQRNGSNLSWVVKQLRPVLAGLPLTPLSFPTSWKHSEWGDISSLKGLKFIRTCSSYAWISVVCA